MGMIIETLKNLLSRPFTVDYPKKRDKVSEKYRGMIHVDRKKCIGCYLCQVHCPTGAILVDPKTKKADVDTGLCIYCSMCEEVCPVKCIFFTNAYENEVKDRKKLVPPRRKK